MAKEEPLLYRKMYLNSFLNLVVFAPSYFLIVQYFVNDNGSVYFAEIFIIILFHNIYYALTHYGMHTLDILKPIHRYHHQYRKNIIPTVGNAVTIKEMFLAYLTPFVFCSIIFQPAMNSLIAGVGVISVFNLLVHSTYLSNTNWIRGLVSPALHIAHHNLYTKHFSAPLLNLDRLLGLC